MSVSLGMYVNSRNGTEQNIKCSRHSSSLCAVAVSSFTSQTKVTAKNKGFPSMVHFAVIAKGTWTGDKPHLHCVNGAYEERLKAVWDSSTAYEKKTKGWQRGAHAVMFSWAKDSSRQIRKWRFSEKDVAQVWLTCSPSMPSTDAVCISSRAAYKWNGRKEKKQHLASFCVESCLWCNSTCLTFQARLEPTYVELN